ncbi:hypothetical protein ASPVEDRAFT_40305 [Aspergillus versicolor CBS 583.65]|uniref:N-acetyltransferase domain-containing protein n=1 Tax=Aspergillus versicolor CBS 583.65 TaxID=1036611 RepID=A0A1L9PGY3_ASPVE|nr:uncharacterized protein ASPVEDRAFT_40305 [Aspergillus versicolor CBS 583.65]OJJ00779.1 hypothetical protein ASPVEDRAFT_40305 [Aspergillus versicolor CBS 583.65]
MPSDKYTIRQFEASDVAATGELLFTQKLGLTINRLLFKNWPNEEAQRKNYTSTLANLDPATMEALTVVENASGEIVGHLIMTRKRPAPKTENAGNGKEGEVPDHFNADVLSAVMRVASELDVVMKDTDHIELTYMIVKPEHRGQGLGQSLLSHVANKAKIEGVPVALVSEPQAYGYWEKKGFTETEYRDIDLAQWAPPHSGFGTFRLSGMVLNPSS